MTDSTLLKIFATAWQGVRQKESKLDHSRFSERYLFDLRKANTPGRRRNLIAELMAEGLIEAGGCDEFSGEEPTLDLWRDGEADGWERLRDLVLIASAI